MMQNLAQVRRPHAFAAYLRQSGEIAASFLLAMTKKAVTFRSPFSIICKAFLSALELWARVFLFQNQLLAVLISDPDGSVFSNTIKVRQLS